MNNKFLVFFEVLSFDGDNVVEHLALDAQTLADAINEAPVALAAMHAKRCVGFNMFSGGMQGSEYFNIGKSFIAEVSQITPLPDAENWSAFQEAFNEAKKKSLLEHEASEKELRRLQFEALKKEFD